MLVWYSSTAIYFGIRAYEAHGAVHATLANRDNIDSDDNVQILLNTFHDGRRALVFAANPLGIQEDGTMVEGNGTSQNGSINYTNRPPTDLSTDYVYETKGHLTAFGYEYRDADSALQHQVSVRRSAGLGIQRHPERAALGTRRVLGPRQALGVIVPAIRYARWTQPLPPPARPRPQPHRHREERRLRPNTRRLGDPQRPAFGGNLRYGITSNLILNGTVNPDFAEVESECDTTHVRPAARPVLRRETSLLSRWTRAIQHAEHADLHAPDRAACRLCQGYRHRHRHLRSPTSRPPTSGRPR